MVKIAGDDVTLQVFEGTEGIPTNAEVVFLGKAPTIKVSDQLAGRFFNQFLQLFVEIVILFRFEFRVVHLLADVNHFLEVIHYLIEVVELKFRMADYESHVLAESHGGRV